MQIGCRNLFHHVLSIIISSDWSSISFKLPGKSVGPVSLFLLRSMIYHCLCIIFLQTVASFDSVLIVSFIFYYIFFFLNSLITMDVTASRFGFWFFFVDKRGVNRCCYVAETEIFATFVLMAEILTRQSLNIFHSICIRSLCFHNLQFTLF